jgi:glycine/D-amino acid oxidase-like deaminating enzyme
MDTTTATTTPTPTTLAALRTAVRRLSRNRAAVASTPSGGAFFGTPDGRFVIAIDQDRRYNGYAFTGVTGYGVTKADAIADAFVKFQAATR